MTPKLQFHGLVFLVAINLLGFYSPPAWTAARVALVVGNSDYLHAPSLENPVNDAADIADQLQAVDFEVHRALNVELAEFRRILRRFTDALRGADTGLFFYAGHGLQADGKNYLVPVDAKLSSKAALDFEVMALETVLRQLEREVPTRIIFLDACRDNPLSQNLSQSPATRAAAVGRGLARVKSGVGSLIAYATAPNTQALDGSGQRNSPYTRALLDHLDTPGLEIGQMLRRVRRDVLASTGQRQVPWESLSLTGDFYFLPGQGKEASATVQDTLADGSLGPEMVRLTARRFRMGDQQGVGRTDERPTFDIVLAQDLLIGRYEITFAQYDRFCDATQRPKPADSGRGRGNRPVINVTYADAAAYAQWLAAQTGQTYRLPTEAEWEYAARAGSQSSYAFGNNPKQLCQYANGADLTAQASLPVKQVTECQDGYTYTAPVGSFAANAWGLHDLHGNAWEWVEDGYRAKAYRRYAASGYQPPDNENGRQVIRGGSWSDPPNALRSAARQGVKPTHQTSNLGFRVVREP